MCVQITLQQNLSYDVVSVFIKRWQLQQYPAGLVTGVTVCFTDVNVKRSKCNKSYFVCTPFTRILHLSSDSNERYLSSQKHFLSNFVSLIRILYLKIAWWSSIYTADEIWFSIC